MAANVAAAEEYVDEFGILISNNFASFIKEYIQNDVDDVNKSNRVVYINFQVVKNEKYNNHKVIYIYIYIYIYISYIRKKSIL